MSAVKRSAVLVLLFLVWAGSAFSADVLFITLPGRPSLKDGMVSQACEFYGLPLKRVRSAEELGEIGHGSSVVGEEPGAIIVRADSLSHEATRKFLGEVTEIFKASVPILLIDIDSNTSEELLRDLSGGAITSCERLAAPAHYPYYLVEDIKAIAGHLSDQKFRITIRSGHALQCQAGPTIGKIVQLATKDMGQSRTVFASVTVAGRSLFLLSHFETEASPYPLRLGLDRGKLLEIIPILAFLRYACGDRCWGPPGYFANLTIDDPWLIGSYGHLDYRALLDEMKTARFHTTIAFVPWNYDRSESDVVSLFRKNADRISVCLHGNNHDHKEFTKSAPRPEQEADILQGLARMDMFSELTGIAYDRVMVFPHAIGPRESLEILKQYNFLATVNGDNLPEGEVRSGDTLSNLRTASADFANFLSVARYGAKASPSDIALELFLGNPVLLYGHHDLFKKGIGSFNSQAGLINKLEPSLRWSNLSTIARNLYLMRKRADGNYDIWAFCRSLEINNPEKDRRTFHIIKPDSLALPISRVEVNGSIHRFEETGAGIRMAVDVPGGARCAVDIEYQNDYERHSIDIQKSDPRVNRLRKLSDFRDLKLSSSSMGRLIVRAYYDSGIYQYGFRRLAFLGLILISVGGLAIVFVFVRLRKKRKTSQTP